MKFLALTMMMISAPVAAQEISPHMVCTKIGELAVEIMTLRQKEHPMSELMSVTSEGSVGEMFIQMIIAAYQQPSYSTPSNQQKAIEEFRNDWELQCYVTIAN